MTAAASSTALSPGSRLGRYQIIRLLAVGGMAEIYLARATGIAGFEKVVVLKRILPSLADDPEFVDMFLDEARLTATLNHPNVVQVHDVDRVDNNYFFTMEFVHGRDLANVLRRAAGKKRGLTLAHALHIVKEVATGLHYAHDKRGKDGHPLGTVHRDVSTNNVMITYDGMVKIVDFGIAKAAMRETKTKTGTVKGTILYMSPEQAQGHELDRRSDVFSLGVLLFQLTTGTRPFNAPSEIAVLFKLVNEDAPLPSTRRPGYPAGLEQIVVKALRRHREERHATAGELCDEIDAFMRSANLVASASTLGAFMREIFDEREDTAEMVAIKLEPDGATPEPIPSAPSPDITPTQPMNAMASEPGPTGIVGTTSVVLPVERATGWKLALGFVALAAIGIGWVLFGPGGSGSTPAAGPSATAELATALPAEPNATNTPSPSASAPAPSATEELASPTPSATAPAATPGPRTQPAERPKTKASQPAAPSAAPPPTKPSAAPASSKPKWDLDSPLPP